MSKDIYKYRKENEQLKEIIEKFVSGEYTKNKFILEYRVLIEKENKEKEG